MSTGEDGDEGVMELLDRRVLDGLLPDMDVLFDGRGQLESLELDPDSGERGVRREVLGRVVRARRWVPPVERNLGEGAPVEVVTGVW